MSMDLTRASALEKEAEKNAGHCTHCEQTIKVYRYGISTTMVRVLRLMADRTKVNMESGEGRTIDVDRQLKLESRERSQLTKMRFHGLVAKARGDDKVQIPRHWLITSKGWDFLTGGVIEAKVVVYNNQVLGHEGGNTTIKRVDGDAGVYEAEPLTQAESRLYANIRQPEYHKQIEAIYQAATSGHFEQGKLYQLSLAKLVVGQPLRIRVDNLPEGVPNEITYRDVAAFGRYWRAL